jgi:small multidrug resistance pump
VVQDAKLETYRRWFLAAAVYNVAWGVLVILAPNALFQVLGMPVPNYPSLFQAIGMMVMVYALGYWLIWKDPVRFGPFVWIGLLGKIFGPIGFFYSALRGELPWVFGLTILTNDLMWWPAFIGFARKYGSLSEPKSQQ